MLKRMSKYPIGSVSLANISSTKLFTAHYLKMLEYSEPCDIIKSLFYIFSLDDL